MSGAGYWFKSAVPDADKGTMGGPPRWAVRAIGATAVVLAVAAGTTAMQRGRTRPDVTISAAGDGRELAVEPAPDTTTTVAPTTVAPPSPTTTGPPPTAVTRATTATTRRAPAPATQPGSRDFGPRRPGSVNLPYRQGQTTWSATSNGIAMTLTTDTANPVAGAPVHFVLEAGPPAGLPCCFFYLLAGDAPAFSTQTSKTDPAGCASPTTGGQRVEARVTFNHGGRFEFLFQAASLCVNPDVSGVVYGFVDVGAGRSTAQGPSLPVLNADDGRAPSQMHDPTLAVAWGQARDEDGYIAGFSVDWGDGTVETFPGDPLGCIPTESGWPRASMSLIPGSFTAPPPSHRYAVPQPRVITVSAWSTGCNGSEVQRVSSMFPWVPPLP